MATDVVNEQRVIIKFYVKLGKTLKDIQTDLEAVYKDNALSKPTISRWMARFVDDRQSVKDDDRKGRPRTSLTSEVIVKVENYVKEDRRVTVREIAETFDISYGSAQAILTKELGMRRVCARWVPRLLLPEQMGVRVEICEEWKARYAAEGDKFLNEIVTCDETWIHFFEPESKQQSSVWKHKSSPSPVKAQLSKSAGKVMCIIFFSAQEIILTHMVPEKTTVNGDYYSRLLKVNLLAAIRKKRPDLARSGFILHHDNAPAHESHLVKSAITELVIERLRHPPYSPDLAPCDFWLFPNLKDSLRGNRYEGRNELKEAVSGSLRTLARDGLQHVMGAWMTRWDKCIQSKGSYFEKDC